MNFIKGAIIGSAITAGVIMTYGDSLNHSKKKMMKTGKKLMKKMGVIAL